MQIMYYMAFNNQITPNDVTNNNEMCLTEVNSLNTSDNVIVYQTPIKVPIDYDIPLPLYPQKDDDTKIMLNYLNGLGGNDENCETDILKSPEFLSPVKTALKIQSNSVKKSISFYPSTSVISNTGEQTPSKYNASFAKGNTSSDMSPEMFSDDGGEDDACSNNYVPFTEESAISTVSRLNTRNKQDRLLLRKLQESSVGILPPPSVTICQLNVDDMLSKYNENKDLYMCHSTSECPNVKKSTFINCDLEEAQDSSFPQIMAKRYHGLHYNRSKTSEDIESLCQKYSERFVGCETASTCTIWQMNLPSSANKRRMIRKQQACKSPGRRLSHLARRRITFSKENLNAKSSVLPTISMSNNQRMIGVKKNDILMKRRASPCKKSPRKRMLISPRKRRTPNKRSPQKQIRTPTSSVKKRRMLNESNSTTPRSGRSLSSKRALFQSPDAKATRSNIKRKLFAKTEEEVGNEVGRKRKRDLDDSLEDVTPQREKFPRSFSSNDVVGEKVKSSFTVTRRHSEMITSNSTDFSEHHTKKMLWAISTALRTQNVGMSHPKFKTYASVLSQICKRLLSDLLPGQTRLPGSVNERMSKIAHQHVYAVVKGNKTVDEIVDEVKSRSVLSQKPKGYIAPDNFHADNISQNALLTTESVPTQNSSSNLVNRNNQMDKSRIRRQITFN